MKQHLKKVDGKSERATQSQVKDLNCTTTALGSLSTILISQAPFDLPQTCITMTTLRILGTCKQAVLPTALTVSVLQSVSLHSAVQWRKEARKQKTKTDFQGFIYKNSTLFCTFGTSSTTTWLHHLISILSLLHFCRYSGNLELLLIGSKVTVVSGAQRNNTDKCRS